MLDLLEVLDLLEMLGLLVVRATLAQQDLLARIPQLQGRQAQLVQRAHKVAHQRLQGLQAHKVFKVFKAKLARLDRQAYKEIALLDQQVLLAHKATQLQDRQA
jgi:hypothetical protein